MSGLFGAGPQRLLDDATGRVEYRPGVLDEATAQAWFGSLHAGIAWQHQRRVMYQPRISLAFRMRR